MAIVHNNNYRDHTDSYSSYFPSNFTLEEKIRKVESLRNYLYCQNPNKWMYFAILIGAIEHDKELAALYEINEDATYWINRIQKKPCMIEPPQVILRPLGRYPDSLPQCYDTSGQGFGGLYFMGATYFNPITMRPIYAVKVGLSYTDIGRRIQSYGTYNPFIYHERTHVLPFRVCREASERKCRSFLNSVSIQQMDKETEWYIVDEKTYLYLCENMKRVSFFAGVATGKIRAI